MGAGGIRRAGYIAQTHRRQPVAAFAVTDQRRIAGKAESGIIEQGVGRQLIQARLGRGGSAHQAVLSRIDGRNAPEMGQLEQAIGEIQLQLDAIGTQAQPLLIA